MCVPYLIEIKPTPRRKSDCIRPITQKADPMPPAKSSPPPCIITIEPRSPKPPSKKCSSEKGGIHVRGEASPRGLALQFERRQEPCKKESPHEPVPSPKTPPAKSPPPIPPICSCPKGGRSHSSSSSSSSSSSVSTRSFRELKEKVEQLLRRATNLEKELQTDRSKANQNLWVGAGRDNKIEREVSGLRDAVGGLGKEVEMLRRGLHFRGEKEVDTQCGDEERERRVRVRWERTRGLPRGTSY